MNAKTVRTFLSGVLCATALFSLTTTSLAATVTEQISAAFMDIKIVLNGETLTPTDATGATVEPFIYNGTTYLPVRAVGEAFGLDVTWDGDTNTVYLGDVPVAETTTETATSTTTPTLGESNALSKAYSYLNYSAFSYTGLIKQLEYEGYTTAEATYAVDNCGADWYEQAVAKAESYLNYTSFSRSGLIGQLEYEGFTTDQATYAVGQVGY